MPAPFPYPGLKSMANLWVKVDKDLNEMIKMREITIESQQKQIDILIKKVNLIIEILNENNIR